MNFHCRACCAAGTAPAAAAAPAAPSSKKRPREPEKLFAPGHSCAKPSEKLRRVRKANQNTGRLFFSCSRSGCNASFHWADDSFPRCKCAGPATKSRLRVCKNGQNGGRWFYGCGKPKGPANCGFFQWAEPAALEKALGAHLRPLT